MRRITEQDSHYRHLEKMSTSELLKAINKEDKTVAYAVEAVLPDIERAVNAIYSKMIDGGRLFYIGAGTSGRLGIVDASECPPTFGVPHGLVVGLIAGGDGAVRKAVEFAEDDPQGAVKDLEAYFADEKDVVLGIAASGTTPYVVGGLKVCRERNITTACITCNPDAPVISHADFPIICPVGPEFVTGSTRMKAGTAQKMILNLISTAVMIRLGRVEDNKMVDMQLSNTKLVERGIKMVMEKTGLNYAEAQKILEKSGSVRNAVQAFIKNQK